MSTRIPLALVPLVGRFGRPQHDRITDCLGGGRGWSWKAGTLEVSVSISSIGGQWMVDASNGDRAVSLAQHTEPGNEDVRNALRCVGLA